MKPFFTLVFSFTMMLMLHSMAAGQTPLSGAETLNPSPVRRVYSHLLEPREHPDYDRRYVHPPSWETFGNRTQFAALRGFGVEDGRIVGFVEALERYTETHKLGTVIWPSYPIIFAENLNELAEEIKRRGLFLFDIWGYVPGSGPGGYWQQYKAPEGVFALLESTLGEHWLGMDIGEQDGRYIGGYASQMLPVSDNRFEQYLNFQRHFEHMGDALGNRLTALVSLNFGHYFLKEGTYATIGAETAQALPNSQVYYAFIRGAGKQYGVPWFGNASVWNRWGWKTYDGEGDDHGPTKGTSLNLLKRLLYSHIFYNCVFVGFESAWFDGEGNLSPIGRIQQTAQQWVSNHGQPGVLVTPVAFMLDFFSGWSFPRHLYTSHVYRVWGNIPYEEGDYLTDALLDMVYPGYQDASYFHDESGFLSPTPYGDSVDCLLSDAPEWLLARYPVLVLAGNIAPSLELRDKLIAYAKQGGCLVITGGNLAQYAEGIGGIRAVPEKQDGENPQNTKTFSLTYPENARVLAESEGRPAAVEVPVGSGRILAFSSNYGLCRNTETNPTWENTVDTRLYQSMRLRDEVRQVLDAVFKREMLFDAGAELTLITCRKEPGYYTLAVTNNALAEKPLKIISRCGDIEEIRELPLDTSEKNAAGYLPEGVSGASVGVSSENTIAGGDVRVFSVRVRERDVEDLPHTLPPSRPRNRALPLREMRPLKEQLLARPTFFEHFDGAVVEWRYLHDRDTEALRSEAGWLKRQGVRLWVDFSSGINLYPDLRLVNNDELPYKESMETLNEVLNKMAVWGARDAIIGLHRVPENNITAQDTQASFEDTLRAISSTAAEHEISLYLRTDQKSGMDIRQVRTLVENVAASNLKLALHTAILLNHQETPDTLAWT